MRALACSVMALILPRRRRPATTWVAARPPRTRCRPGSPARRTPRRRPRGRRPAATAARMRRTRSRCPTAYCGSAPPHRWTCASTGRHREPDRRRRGRPAPARRARRRWRCSTCSSRCRPIEQRITSTSSASPGGADPVPLGEGERRGLHRRARPPAAPGSPEPGGVGEVAGPERQRDDRHRGVLDRAPAPAAASGATSASSRAARRGRGGEHHRVGVQHLGVPRRARPPGSSRPRRRGPGRARSPRCARRGPAAAATAPGSWPSPRRARRTPGRRTVCGSAAAAARIIERSRSQQRHDLRHRGAGGDLAGVAGVDPAEQRLHEPVDDLAAEPLLDQPADADVLAVEPGGRQRRAPARPGPGPAAESTPLSASARASAGTPIRVRGIGRSRAARPQVRASWRPGARPGRRGPTPRASATASGRRLSIDSAPTSTVTPPTSASASLPPTAGRRPRGPRPRRPAPYDGRPPPPRARRCRRRPRPRAAAAPRRHGFGSEEVTVPGWQRPGHDRQPGGTARPRAASQGQSRGGPAASNGTGHMSWGTASVRRLVAARRAAHARRARRLQRRRRQQQRRDVGVGRVGQRRPAPRRRPPRTARRAEAAPGVERTVVRTPSVIRTGRDLDHRARTSAGRPRGRRRPARGGRRLGRTTSRPRTTATAASTQLDAGAAGAGRTGSTATKKALERLGRLKTSDESAKDVTTEVIDVDERVQTLQNSLDRLQRYQRSAKDVTRPDPLRGPDHRSGRPSCSRSRRSSLPRRPDLDVDDHACDLSTPEKYVAPPGALEDAGFLAGLKAAGTRSATRRGRGADRARRGAAVPASVGALVGVPAWLGLRGAAPPPTVTHQRRR